MGLFLSMSGIVGSSKGAVEDSIREWAAANGGTFDPVPNPPASWQGMVIGESNGNVTVVYPERFYDWQPLSASLSKSLNAPVFFLHIHDGDLWMYELYVQGNMADRFNPIPAYWSEDLSESEIQTWRGNPAIVARWCPGVTEESIKAYLVRWDLENPNLGKAYEDDEFGFIDWQLTDFMRKLRLRYPIDNHGKITGRAYQFAVNKPKRPRNA
jgi:hypothetical protein